jgi:hypothetical protein
LLFKEKENKAKLNKMPEIRMMNTENNIKKIIEDSRKNELNSHRGKFSIKGLSRETILSNMEFQGYYITHMKNKPKSRKQSTMILFEDKLYLYGGLSFNGMDDIWVFDLSGI